VIWSGFPFSNATAARVFMAVFLLVDKPVISKSAAARCVVEGLRQNGLRRT
jgi:hypothetical protein